MSGPGNATRRTRNPSLAVSGDELASPAAQRALLDSLPLVHEFDEAVRDAVGANIFARAPRVLQMNLGRVCNQTCRHCHVDAGPDREESMSDEVVDACLALLERSSLPVVDITGGAPEIHPAFRRIVRRARELGRHVMVRCNLTVLDTAPCADLPELFATLGVEVVASLPHYRATNTDLQRGAGVHEKSLRVLSRLNQLGYGRGAPDKRLVLVTNPVGAFMPAAQGSLEGEWKRELERLHGVSFDALLTLTNMPIGRHLAWMEQNGTTASYVAKLAAAFNPAAVRGLMCIDTLSVAWDGRLYDCDFNQMLELPSEGGPTVFDLDLESLAGRVVATGRHCFGCTAGQGSSCGGAIV